MLVKLGDFLAVLVEPLKESGQLLALNATAASQTLGTEGDSIMYTWFLAMGGPFIDKTGDMLVATGDFTLAVSNFLISLAGLL
jgi:hypothetical protein